MTFWNPATILALILVSSISAAFGQEAAERSILICVGRQASEPVRLAAEQLARDARSVPALNALLQTQRGSGPVQFIDSESLYNGGPQADPQFHQAAFNHLLVIGLSESDPLLRKTVGFVARLDEKQRSFYSEGVGHLRGDIGYVEADWNPFLHSRRVSSAPFETCLFRITGTTEAGVLAAIEAFRAGLNNGVVPTGEWSRGQMTILDRDPLARPCPLALPQSLAGAKLLGAGWTQPPENEYRAVLDVAGHEPVAIWRVKYLQAGNFDRVSQDSWWRGLHRMAGGNAVNVIQFRTAEQAAQTAKALGDRRAADDRWEAVTLGPFQGWQSPPPVKLVDEDREPIMAFAWREYLLMLCLPKEAAMEAMTAITQPARP